MIWFALALAAPSDDELDRAMELYDNGHELYAEGQYQAAIEAWEASYGLSGRQLLWFNIANAQERLGRYADAIASLNRYRAFAPAEEREQLDQRVRSLQRLEEERDALAMPAGSALAPAPAPVPAPAPAPEPEPEPEPERRSSKELFRKVGMVTGFTLGAAGLGVGVLLGNRASKGLQSVEARCVPVAEGLICPSTVQEDLRVSRNRAIVADTFMVAGVLGVATGFAFQLGVKGPKATVGLDGLVLKGDF